jgi:hypothetical protein
LNIRKIDFFERKGKRRKLRKGKYKGVEFLWLLLLKKISRKFDITKN